MCGCARQKKQRVIEEIVLGCRRIIKKKLKADKNNVSWSMAWSDDGCSKHDHIEKIPITNVNDKTLYISTENPLTSSEIAIILG